MAGRPEYRRDGQSGKARPDRHPLSLRPPQRQPYLLDQFFGQGRVCFVGKRYAPDHGAEFSLDLFKAWPARHDLSWPPLPLVARQ